MPPLLKAQHKVQPSRTPLGRAGAFSQTPQLHMELKGLVPFPADVINYYHDATSYQVEQSLVYTEEKGHHVTSLSSMSVQQPQSSWFSSV